jgi:hypothetical protein
VYVHPRGVVTESNGALKWHATGVMLSQHRPLSEAEQPEVWHELKKLEARASGISDAPG